VFSLILIQEFAKNLNREISMIERDGRDGLSAFNWFLIWMDFGWKIWIKEVKANFGSKN
jgi:hypothetical protein